MHIRGGRARLSGSAHGSLSRWNAGGGDGGNGCTLVQLDWREPMVEKSSEVETTHKFPTEFLAILG